MAELLKEIDRFLTSKSMSASAFGDAALGDRHFVRQLRRGREPRSRTVAKVLNYMRQDSGAACQ